MPAPASRWPKCCGTPATTCGAAAVRMEALRQLDGWSADVIVTDLKMPGMNGLEFIRALSQRPCDAQVVMVTAHATVSSAVDAMRLGAFDYIEKPFGAEQLEQLVARACITVTKLRHSLPSPPAPPPIAPRAGAPMVGDSPAMRELRRRIQQAAPTDETVLITGESGTGKELVARHLHAASRRARAAFVSLNCPALSPQLMESELFGHERGAFTGADAARVGRFELADRGTVLLDEISEIQLPLQAKLLRVLQEQSFERVGSSVSKHVDVRVLATSNRDLPRGSQGRPLPSGSVLPSGRGSHPCAALATAPRGHSTTDRVLPARSAQRLEQTPPAIQTAGHRTADPSPLAGQCAGTGEHHHARQRPLRTRAHYGRSTAALADRLPRRPPRRSAQDAAAHIEVGMSLQDMERKLIETTLDHYQGHRAKTAQALGIGIRTLSNKLRSYGYAPREKSFVRAA